MTKLLWLFLLLVTPVNAQITASGSIAANTCADTGSTDSYACSILFIAPAYCDGQIFWFKANTANTGPATINFNGLGAKTIVKVINGISTSLSDNDIRAGQWVNVVYDGQNMQMLSVLGNTLTLPVGTGAGTVAAGDDSRMTNARIPTAHASTHVTGGSDVIANVVASGNAGLMTGADKTKLDGVAAGATANATDAQLRDRSTHTGSQAESTVTNLVTDLAAKAPLASPILTGTPAAPTPAFATNTTQVATTAYVVSAAPAYARVTGSNATTTGQSLTPITGLSVALTTNAVYEFEANLTVSTSAVTTGTEYGVNYSVAGGAVEATVSGSLTSSAMQTVRLNALNTATVAFLTTSGQSGGIVIKGIITTGANAGSLVVQHLKVTSGTSTVFTNSYLRVIRIQ